MKILAVETATEACSAALFLDGEIIERCRLAPREHSRLILPMMQSLLDEAGIALNRLDALAFGRGPGSFTGVRIAAGVIQGAALGADLPVVPVSTLAALAQASIVHFEAEYAFSALDARIGEVYWGVYRRNGEGFAEVEGAEAVVDANRVLFPDEAVGIGVGSGWQAYPDVLKKRLGSRVVRIEGDRYPTAGFVVRLGVEGLKNDQAVSAELALPVYLRNTVAHKMAGRKAARE
jgi:tRNA threonylcarbamoyladenosine biosynthesis protein TsaB